MEDFISKNWQWILSAIVGVFTVISGMAAWFYKTFIKNPIIENKNMIAEQNQNYNKKFDETHKKIERVDQRVLIVQQDTSEIMGSVKTILTLMEKK